MRDLQVRYPHNPLFYQIEAEIHDIYFHDTAAAVAVLAQLIARAETHRVNAPDVAMRRARTLARRDSIAHAALTLYRISPTTTENMS